MPPSDPTGGLAPVSRRVMNLSRFVTQAARRQPDATAFVRGEDSWSWRQLDARIDALASALRERFGVRKGDRILVQSQNCNEMFETMFACFRVGAVYVPTNFRQTPDEVAYLARSSGASGLVCNARFPDHAAAVREAVPGLAFAIAIGDAAFGVSFGEAIAPFKGREAPVEPVEHDDPAWFFYTSGTTGRPKAGVLTHGQLAFVVNNHLCDLMPGTGPADASLVLAPLSHGAGVHQLAQVAAGVKTILMPGDGLDVEAAFALIERWRVTNMFTVPTILKMLAEHPAADRHDHSSLRYVIYAGAPMYREDQKRALAAFGPVLVQYFGLGEVTGAITVLPASLHSAEDGADARIGTCGLPRTGMEIAIQDEAGRTLAPGETGEICVVGPAVFAGYYDNPDANAKAFRDGWFRTGDLGHVDEAGFLYITGRSSDMYISGGSNVYPREIEEKILAHPGVSEVAVLGVPDPMWGEVGLAVCVAAADGAPVDEREILSFLDGRLSRYKVPKRVLFLEALPKSAYGKTPKKLVRAELERRGLLQPAGTDGAAGKAAG